MKYGLTDSELSYLNETLVTPLVREGAKVWLFGSRARGDHHKYSDVDIMVEGGPDLGKLLSQIREEFTESNFPFKLDLVLLDDFADEYRSQFEAEKVQLVGG